MTINCEFLRFASGGKWDADLEKKSNTKNDQTRDMNQKTGFGLARWRTNGRKNNNK